MTTLRELLGKEKTSDGAPSTLARAVRIEQHKINSETSKLSDTATTLCEILENALNDVQLREKASSSFVDHEVTLSEVASKFNNLVSELITIEKIYFADQSSTKNSQNFPGTIATFTKLASAVNELAGMFSDSEQKSSSKPPFETIISIVAEHVPTAFKTLFGTALTALGKRENISAALIRAAQQEPSPSATSDDIYDFSSMNTASTQTAIDKAQTEKEAEEKAKTYKAYRAIEEFLAKQDKFYRDMQVLASSLKSTTLDQKLIAIYEVFIQCKNPFTGIKVDQNNLNDALDKILDKFTLDQDKEFKDPEIRKTFNTIANAVTKQMHFFDALESNKNLSEDFKNAISEQAIKPTQHLGRYTLALQDFKKNMPAEAKKITFFIALIEDKNQIINSAANWPSTLLDNLKNLREKLTNTRSKKEENKINGLVPKAFKALIDAKLVPGHVNIHIVKQYFQFDKKSFDTTKTKAQDQRGDIYNILSNTFSDKFYNPSEIIAIGERIGIEISKHEALEILFDKLKNQIQNYPILNATLDLNRESIIDHLLSKKDDQINAFFAKLAKNPTMTFDPNILNDVDLDSKIKKTPTSSTPTTSTPPTPSGSNISQSTTSASSTNTSGSVTPSFSESKTNRGDDTPPPEPNKSGEEKYSDKNEKDTLLKRVAKLEKYAFDEVSKLRDARDPTRKENTGKIPKDAEDYRYISGKVMPYVLLSIKPIRDSLESKNASAAQAPMNFKELEKQVKEIEEATEKLLVAQGKPPAPVKPLRPEEIARQRAEEAATKQAEEEKQKAEAAASAEEAKRQAEETTKAEAEKRQAETAALKAATPTRPPRPKEMAPQRAEEAAAKQADEEKQKAEAAANAEEAKRQAEETAKAEAEKRQAEIAALKAAEEISKQILEQQTKAATPTRPPRPKEIARQRAEEAAAKKAEEEKQKVEAAAKAEKQKREADGIEAAQQIVNQILDLQTETAPAKTPARPPLPSSIQAKRQATKEAEGAPSSKIKNLDDQVYQTLGQLDEPGKLAYINLLRGFLEINPRQDTTALLKKISPPSWATSKPENNKKLITYFAAILKEVNKLPLDTTQENTLKNLTNSFVDNHVNKSSTQHTKEEKAVDVTTPPPIKTKQAWQEQDAALKAEQEEAAKKAEEEKRKAEEIAAAKQAEEEKAAKQKTDAAAPQTWATASQRKNVSKPTNDLTIEEDDENELDQNKKSPETPAPTRHSVSAAAIQQATEDRAKKIKEKEDLDAAARAATQAALDAEKADTERRRQQEAERAQKEKEAKTHLDHTPGIDPFAKTANENKGSFVQQKIDLFENMGKTSDLQPAEKKKRKKYGKKESADDNATRDRMKNNLFEAFNLSDADKIEAKIKEERYKKVIDADNARRATKEAAKAQKLKTEGVDPYATAGRGFTPEAIQRKIDELKEKQQTQTTSTVTPTQTNIQPNQTESVQESARAHEETDGDPWRSAPFALKVSPQIFAAYGALMQTSKTKDHIAPLVVKMRETDSLLGKLLKIMKLDQHTIIRNCLYHLAKINSDLITKLAETDPTKTDYTDVIAALKALTLREFVQLMAEVHALVRGNIEDPSSLSLTELEIERREKILTSILEKQELERLQKETAAAERLKEKRLDEQTQTTSTVTPTQVPNTVTSTQPNIQPDQTTGSTSGKQGGDDNDKRDDHNKRPDDHGRDGGSDGNKPPSEDRDSADNKKRATLSAIAQAAARLLATRTKIVAQANEKKQDAGNQSTNVTDRADAYRVAVDSDEIELNLGPEPLSPTNESDNEVTGDLSKEMDDNYDATQDPNSHELSETQKEAQKQALLDKNKDEVETETNKIEDAVKTDPFYSVAGNLPSGTLDRTPTSSSSTEPEFDDLFGNINTTLDELERNRSQQPPVEHISATTTDFQEVELKDTSGQTDLTTPQKEEQEKRLDEQSRAEMDDTSTKPDNAAALQAVSDTRAALEEQHRLEAERKVAEEAANKNKEYTNPNWSPVDARMPGIEYQAALARANQEKLEAQQRAEAELQRLIAQRIAEEEKRKQAAETAARLEEEKHKQAAKDKTSPDVGAIGNRPDQPPASNQGSSRADTATRKAAPEIIDEEDHSADLIIPIPHMPKQTDTQDADETAHKAAAEAAAQKTEEEAKQQEQQRLAEEEKRKKDEYNSWTTITNGPSNKLANQSSTLSTKNPFNPLNWPEADRPSGRTTLPPLHPAADAHTHKKKKSKKSAPQEAPDIASTSAATASITPAQALDPNAKGHDNSRSDQPPGTSMPLNSTSSTSTPTTNASGQDDSVKKTNIGSAPDKTPASTSAATIPSTQSEATEDKEKQRKMEPRTRKFVENYEQMLRDKFWKDIPALRIKLKQPQYKDSAIVALLPAMRDDNARDKLLMSCLISLAHSNPEIEGLNLGSAKGLDAAAAALITLQPDQLFQIAAKQKLLEALPKLTHAPLVHLAERLGMLDIKNGPDIRDENKIDPLRQAIRATLIKEDLALDASVLDAIEIVSLDEEKNAPDLAVSSNNPTAERKREEDAAARQAEQEAAETKHQKDREKAAKEALDLLLEQQKAAQRLQEERQDDDQRNAEQRDPQKQQEIKTTNIAELTRLFENKTELSETDKDKLSVAADTAAQNAAEAARQQKEAEAKRQEEEQRKREEDAAAARQAVEAEEAKRKATKNTAAQDFIDEQVENDEVTPTLTQPGPLAVEDLDLGFDQNDDSVSPSVISSGRATPTERKDDSIAASVVSSEDEREEQRKRADLAAEEQRKQEAKAAADAAAEQRKQEAKAAEDAAEEQRKQEAKAAEDAAAEQRKQEAKAAEDAAEEQRKQEAKAAADAAEEQRKQEAKAAADAAEEQRKQEAKAAADATEEQRKQEAKAAADAAEEQRKQEAKAAEDAAAEQRKQEAKAAADAAEEQRKQEAKAAADAAEEQRKQEAKAAADAAAEQRKQEAKRQEELENIIADLDLNPFAKKTSANRGHEEDVAEDQDKKKNKRKNKRNGHEEIRDMDDDRTAHNPDDPFAGLLNDKTPDSRFADFFKDDDNQPPGGGGQQPNDGDNGDNDDHRDEEDTDNEYDEIEDRDDSQAASNSDNPFANFFNDDGNQPPGGGRQQPPPDGTGNNGKRLRVGESDGGSPDGLRPQGFKVREGDDEEKKYENIAFSEAELYKIRVRFERHGNIKEYKPYYDELAKIEKSLNDIIDQKVADEKQHAEKLINSAAKLRALIQSKEEARKERKFIASTLVLPSFTEKRPDIYTIKGSFEETLKSVLAENGIKPEEFGGKNSEPFAAISSDVTPKDSPFIQENWTPDIDDDHFRFSKVSFVDEKDHYDATQKSDFDEKKYTNERSACFVERARGDKLNLEVRKMPHEMTVGGLFDKYFETVGAKGNGDALADYLQRRGAIPTTLPMDSKERDAFINSIERFSSIHKQGLNASAIAKAYYKEIAEPDFQDKMRSLAVTTVNQHLAAKGGIGGKLAVSGIDPNLAKAMLTFAKVRNFDLGVTQNDQKWINAVDNTDYDITVSQKDINEFKAAIDKASNDVNTDKCGLYVTSEPKEKVLGKVTPPTYLICTEPNSTGGTAPTDALYYIENNPTDAKKIDCKAEDIAKLREQYRAEDKGQDNRKEKLSLNALKYITSITGHQRDKKFSHMAYHLDKDTMELLNPLASQMFADQQKARTAAEEMKLISVLPPEDKHGAVNVRRGGGPGNGRSN